MPSRSAASRRSGDKPRSLIEQAARSGDPRREQLARDVRAAGGVSAYGRAHGVPRTTVQGALALNKTSRSAVVERFVLAEERVTFMVLYFAYEGDTTEAGDPLPERGSADEEAALASVYNYRREDLPTLREARSQLDGLAANVFNEHLVRVDSGIPAMVYARQSGRATGVPKLVGWRIYLAPRAEGRELVQPPPIEIVWRDPGPALQTVIDQYEADLGVEDSDE